ncbi:hypothetical protein TH53_11520 [Pedobacter lusitanus]|uniref:Uncharacterized protein n=1 Tax=Pedobacter lusitanus TaxID=1503925 RepID=A0A0D0F627_9SPHI|nr:hypothetical protein TH53_11520 [Pedobacter lusitanus]
MPIGFKKSLFLITPAPLVLGIFSKMQRLKRFYLPDKCAYKAGCSTNEPIFFKISILWLLISFPKIKTVSPGDFNRLSKILIVVVLPAPLWPRKP